MEFYRELAFQIHPEDGWVDIGEGFQVRAIRESDKNKPQPVIKSDLLAFAADKTHLDGADTLTYGNPRYSKGPRDRFQHRCHYCTRTFSAFDFKTMRDHLGSHAKIGCGYCEQRFHSIQECIWHRFRVHRIGSFHSKPLGFLYICKCCHLGLSTEERMYDHLKKCHLDYIRKEFPKALVFLEDHQGADPDIPRHFCKSCDATITEDIHIKAHLAWHKRKPRAEPRFRCPRCPEDFSNQKLFAQHLISHAEEQRGTSKVGERYVCLYCQRDYAHYHTVIEHIRKKHAVLNPNHCLYCPCEFPTAEIHREHNRTSHGLVQRILF